uniref:Putative secreted protein n=1 Tax=Ixodes ricinus TaxID=34613 RepID=A0A6B0U9F8_IXORI
MLPAAWPRGSPAVLFFPVFLFVELCLCEGTAKGSWTWFQHREKTDRILCSHCPVREELASPPWSGLDERD